MWRTRLTIDMPSFRIWKRFPFMTRNFTSTIWLHATDQPTIKSLIWFIQIPPINRSKDRNSTDLMNKGKPCKIWSFSALLKVCCARARARNFSSRWLLTDSWEIFSEVQAAWQQGCLTPAARPHGKNACLVKAVIKKMKPDALKG